MTSQNDLSDKLQRLIPGKDGGYYRIAVAERPFEQDGKHTQRMKVVNYESNVLIGAISAEGGDIAKALSSHSNSGYDFGYIGNGPNGWVYDSDGDLSYNGQQVNSYRNRNQVSRLQAQTDPRSRSNQVGGPQAPRGAEWAIYA
jgi:hypothetical protein